MKQKTAPPPLKTPNCQRDFVQNEQVAEALSGCGEVTLAQKKHWAALASVEGIGPMTFYSILKHLNKNQISWDDFWGAKGHLLAKIPIKEKIGESIKKFINEEINNLE